MTKRVKPRVLVVDDSEVVCESTKHALELGGFEAVTLTSPFGFIKAVRESAPAIILLDIGLGTMNGTRLVQLGRQHAARSTRILLYSVREDAVLDHDVKLCGADGFVNKRVVGDELSKTLRRWLGGDWS
jgi:DNA-binding NarL/FixJ family response regulator